MNYNVIDTGIDKPVWCTHTVIVAGRLNAASYLFVEFNSKNVSGKCSSTLD